MTLPSLSLTVTVWTMRRVVARKTAAASVVLRGATCAARAATRKRQQSQRPTPTPNVGSWLLGLEVAWSIANAASRTFAGWSDPPHLVGAARQTELRAADERVDAGIGHVFRTLVASMRKSILSRLPHGNVRVMPAFSRTAPAPRVAPAFPHCPAPAPCRPPD